MDEFQAMDQEVIIEKITHNFVVLHTCTLSHLKNFKEHYDYGICKMFFEFRWRTMLRALTHFLAKSGLDPWNNCEGMNMMKWISAAINYLYLEKEHSGLGVRSTESCGECSWCCIRGFWVLLIKRQNQKQCASTTSSAYYSNVVVRNHLLPPIFLIDDIRLCE